MIRTQISLEKSDYAAVKKQARKEGISIAEFVRRSVKASLPVKAHGDKPWMKYAGFLDSNDPHASVNENIDDVIYGPKG